MDPRHILTYLGISVILYFISQLLQYWLDYVEGRNNHVWYLWPIGAIFVLLSIISMPVGLMIYILDCLYSTRRRREQFAKETSAESKGKRIGYKLGKTDGYMSGFMGGYYLGLQRHETGTSLTESEINEIAKSSIQSQLIMEPHWFRIPTEHKNSYEYHIDPIDDEPFYGE